MGRKETFSLPWPPTANSSKYQRRDGKGMASTTKLKKFHEAAFYELRHKRIKKMNPPYRVKIIFHAPNNVHRYDIANYEKAVNDSLVKAGVITDDCKIDELLLIRGDKCDPGFVWVRVTEIEPCNPRKGVV